MTSMKPRLATGTVVLVSCSLIALAKYPGRAYAQETTTPGGTISGSAPVAGGDMTAIQAAMDQHQYARAEKMLSAWLATHPDDRNARFLYAHALMFQNKTTASLAQFDQLLALDPGNLDYQLGKAKALVRAHRAAEAIPLLETVRAASPQTEDVYHVEILALRMTGDTTRLAQVQQAAAQQFPNVDWANADRPGSSAAVNRATPAAAPLEIEVGAGYDWLDHGYGFWRHEYIEGVDTLGAHHNVYGVIDEGERFKQEDVSLTAGTNFPITPKLTGIAEVNGSPTHKVLAQWSLLGGLQYDFGNGLDVQGGERHSQFDFGHIDQQYGMIEKFFGPYRAAYVLTVSETPGSSAAFSNGGQLSYYYGGRSSVGVGVDVGQQHVSIVTGGQNVIVKSDTTDFDLFGQHWFQPAWGATYDFGWHHLGGFFNRQSVQLGIRHAF